MKVSFDFDDTLSEGYVQAIAFGLILLKHEVYIITARTDYPNVSQHKDLFEVAMRLGIPRNRIHFTNGYLKTDTIKRLGIELHFDDMEDEIDSISENSTCKTMLVNFNIKQLINILKHENNQ